jgi:DNA-binding CsgD family transcriptional regulator
LDNLSDRELQVFRLVGQGFQCSEIAKRLHLSPKTIETHCAKIRTKLNLISTGEFRRYAIQWNSGEKTSS